MARGRFKKEDGMGIPASVDVDQDFDIVDEIEETRERVDVLTATHDDREGSFRVQSVDSAPEGSLVNCLRPDKVIVRFIPKSYCSVTNPKHILYGGMSEASKRTFVVPSLRSGTLANVLTNAEMAFLENYMGLAKGALSVHKKVENFWMAGTQGGIYSVTLGKGDNYFDLSDPMDYIRYKILLANKDFIAPDMATLQDRPKSTYQFVCLLESEQASHEVSSMNDSMKAYMEFGKISEDEDKLRFIVEVIDGKPLSPSTKLDLIKSKVNTIVQGKTKLFLQVVTDQYLDTKVMIKKAVKRGIISTRGGFFYLAESNTPLCGNGKEPTFSNAAIFLNLPSSYELLLGIQNKLKQ